MPNTDSCQWQNKAALMHPFKFCAAAVFCTSCPAFNSGAKGLHVIKHCYWHWYYHVCKYIECGKGKVGGTYTKRLKQENIATHVVGKSVIAVGDVPKVHTVSHVQQVVVQSFNTSSVIQNKKLLAITVTWWQCKITKRFQRRREKNATVASHSWYWYYICKIMGYDMASIKQICVIFHVYMDGRMSATTYTGSTNPHFPGSGTEIQIKTALEPLIDKTVICWNCT